MKARVATRCPICGLGTLADIIYYAREDLEGHPYVGPAGRILDRALDRASIDRDAVYVTNAVKHFHNEPRGKKRIHRKPNLSHVRACEHWLRDEIAVVRPEIVVALGATA